MTGYDSYVSSFPSKPGYTREVLYPGINAPLYVQLRSRGILVETEKRGAKILSAADGAVSYQVDGGGVAEVLTDRYSGTAVLITVPVDQVDAYIKYHAPLPFWAWCSG